MSGRITEKPTPWQRWTREAVSGLQVLQLVLGVLAAIILPLWQLNLRLERLEWEQIQAVNRRAEDHEWRKQTDGDLKAMNTSLARQTATLEAVLALVRKGS